MIAEAECGYCGPAEDTGCLAENILKFAQADRVSMGQNARCYYNEHFRKEQFIAVLETSLQEFDQ